MSKVEDYARALDGLDDPEPYLLEHSGLPGPRGNIELGLAAARVCDAAQLRRWAALDAQAAPTGGAGEFLAFCGVVGLGRLLAEGDASALDELRTHADDSRWRVREAVAMALQRWGADDFQAPGDGDGRLGARVLARTPCGGRGALRARPAHRSAARAGRAGACSSRRPTG